MRLLKNIIKAIFGLAIIGLGAFLIFAPGIVESSRNTVIRHENGNYTASTEAQKLHKSLIVGDWHADSLLWKRDLRVRSDRGQADIPRLQEGNVAIQMFTAVTKSPSGQNYGANATDASDNITLLAMGQLWPIRTWDNLLERALYQAEKLHRFAADRPQDLKIITSLNDLENVLERRANGEKIIGGLLGTEGAHPLEGAIDNLDKLHDAGYRLIGLQHFFDNRLGGSLHGTSKDGLTEFGKQVVQALAKRDFVIDVAHSSIKVARDVLALVDVPIVVSHTGIYSHCETQRNFPDTLMQEIASEGGIIAIGFWDDVTCDDSPMGIAKTLKAAIDLVGSDHVSLGSDFDGSVGTSFDTSELSLITDALLALNIPEANIRKVMGENMIRLLRQRLK